MIDSLNIQTRYVDIRRSWLNPAYQPKPRRVYGKDFDNSKKYGTDFLGDYKNKIFKMSKCELYLQTWKGQSSTEMRGYISKKNINNIVEYNIKELEDKLCYYNKIIYSLTTCIKLNSTGVLRPKIFTETFSFFFSYSIFQRN